MRLLVVACALLVPAPAPVAAQSAASIAEAVQSVTAEDILNRIGVIAHDSMKGRNTPSPELDQTADYIASEFRRIGLKPGGNEGSYLQHYLLYEVQLDTTRATVSVGDGPTWRFGQEVVRYIGGFALEGTSGPTLLMAGSMSGADALAGIPIEGSIVVYLAEIGADGQLDRATRRTVFGIARQRPNALLVVGDPSEQAWADRAQRQLRPSLRLASRRRSTPILLLRASAIDALLTEHLGGSTALNGTSGLEHRELPGLEITLDMTQTVIREHSVPNVAGILEGSDPNLKSEFVLFTAHMDHLGSSDTPLSSCRAAGDDTICNGADDNASGTATIIEAAEAYALLDPRPKRSLMFLAVSAEEKGLLGSRYFAEHPTVPISQIVADLNVDMVGRNSEETIAVIGLEHSDLGETLKRVSDGHPELDLEPIPDPWPEERLYFRSDHYNFARRGVPILFFFSGVHEDYHRPSDVAEKINTEKVLRFTRLLFYLGLEVANAEQRPQWDPESYGQIVEPVAAESSQ